MAVEGLGGGTTGIAFLVSAGLVAEIVAKACSSPQTVEINAGTRAATLMKWVNIGMAEAALLVLIAAAVDRQHRTAVLLGGPAEGIITYVEDMHGKRSALAGGGPGTEPCWLPTRARSSSGWGPTRGDPRGARRRRRR